MNATAPITAHQETQTVMETVQIAGLDVEHAIPANKRFHLPLVFTHGMCCTGPLFRELMEALAERGFECYAPTLRTEQPDGSGARIDDSVKDLTRLIQSIWQKHDKPVIDIGHSMGVLITNPVAVRNHLLVAGHIAMTSAPPRGRGMAVKAWPRLPKYIGQLWGRTFSLERRDAAELFFNEKDPAKIEGYLSQMRSESSAAIREVLLWKHTIEKPECPCLLIKAEHDRITPYQSLVEKKLGVSGANVVEVPTSHMLMCHPNMHTVVKAIVGWLHRGFNDEFYP